MGVAAAWTPAELWSLFDLSHLAGGKGLDRYLAHSLESCARWFRASGASIFLLDEVGGPYSLRAKAGRLSTVPDDAILRTGVGIAGHAIREGRPMLVGNPEEIPELLQAGARRRADLASAMVIPLVEPATLCIGVLNLSRALGEPEFGPEDLEAGRALAAHLTLAISNARLVDRLATMLRDTLEMGERLRGVVEGVSGAVLLVDADGMIISRNRFSYDLLGPSADLYRGLRESRLRELGIAVQDVLDSDIPRSRRAHEASGDRFWLVQGTPLRNGAAVLTIQDITEHERAQREHQRLQRLAEIGQMTAAIAHEIRNPLTGIRAAAQMLAAEDEQVAEFARMIQSEAMRLDGLCSDFLDFARPLALHPGETELKRLAEEVIHSVEADFRQSNVGLRLDASAATRVHVDSARIHQVLLNLLVNARQASEPGGHVLVQLHEDGFSVQDSGRGMNADTLGRLFTPFFTTKASGTGLGLCTVRKIVDAHGGRVDVESRLGKGTRFRIHLPLAAARGPQ